MTCIAAATDGRRVAIGADSLAVEACGQTVEVAKLIDFGGGVLMGVAGRAFSIPLLRRRLQVSAPGGADLDGWAQDLAEQATVLLIDAGLVEEANEREFCGALILVHAGRIWEIETSMALPIRRSYHAIGSGDQAAAGAMWALAGGDRPVADVVRLAVEAACEHQVDVGGRIDVLEA